MAKRKQLQHTPRLTRGLWGDTVRNHGQLLQKVESWRGEVDYIVLDAPAQDVELTRAILQLSDLALVPLGTCSDEEIRATAEMLPLIKEAQKLQPLAVRIVCNRLRPYTRRGKEFPNRVQQALGLATLPSLGARVPYSKALRMGHTVAEMPDRKARHEVSCIAAEVKRLVK
jgi:chromosome partitioning protein